MFQLKTSTGENSHIGNPFTEKSLPSDNKQGSDQIIIFYKINSKGIYNRVSQWK